MPIESLAALDDQPAISVQQLARLGIVDPSGWAGEQPPAREWLLESWIPWRKATFLTGPGQAGKSLAAQQLCTCTALGVPFLGVQPRQARALYVTCEDGIDELQRRQRAICQALGVSEAATNGKLWLASWVGQQGTELATFSGGNGRPEPADEFGGSKPADLLKPTARFRNLQEASIALEVQFIALDNVAQLFIGNENARAEVAAFMGLMEKLALTTGAVLLIGHPNKAGDQWSGSTAWENQVRSRLYMESPKDEAGYEADSDARVLRVGKANYAKRGAEIIFRWHEGAFVLDRDIPDDLRERLANTAQATGDNAVFLACLAERNKQERPVSESTGPNYAPAIFAKMPESRGIGKRRLSDAMDRLFRLGTIKHAVLGRDTRAGRDRHGLTVVE